ncbi:MAG TPA: ABC transporter permease subunit [Candidatus Competibacter sp.]|nr:ABC transporter permease subunit [Candidatus Competibacter sp.]
MIFVIAARELRSLFLSPLAWTLLAVVQGLLAWIFLLLIDDFRNLQGRLIGLENAPGVTDLIAAPLFRVAAWCLLILTPLLTMRLFSEERRTRTFDLLLSAPIETSAIVLGKYLGILVFLLGTTILVALMPLSLAAGTSLDFGKLLAGLLGLDLLVASFAAVGLYMSTLTAQPAVAAVSTLGLLLFLCFTDFASIGRETADNLLGYLSPLRHYDALLSGLFDSADAAYYLLFSAAFLGLTIRRLDDGRLRD